MDKPSLVEDLKEAWLLTIMIALGFVCLSYFVYEYFAFKTIGSWSQTQGTIQKASIGYYEIGSGPRGRSRSGMFYEPYLHYSYVVEGQQYESDQLILGGPKEYTSIFEAAAFVKRYPEGSTITVYYQPNNPQRAILFPNEVGRYVWQSLFMGLVMAGYNSLIFFGTSAWCQYHFNYVPEKEEKEQPTFMKRRLSRRERKQQQLRQR